MLQDKNPKISSLFGLRKYCLFLSSILTLITRLSYCVHYIRCFQVFIQEKMKTTVFILYFSSVFVCLEKICSFVSSIDC